jgi:hypothetical protein
MSRSLQVIEPTCVVNAKLHPMLSEVTRDVATPGETVQQIVDRLGKKNGVNQWYCKKVYVEINGVPLLPAAYDRTVVKSSDKLVIQYNIPEGGEGKNPLRTILMVVVTIVALWVGQLQVLGMWAPYVGAAVGLVGAFAVNALVPAEGLSDVGLGHDSSDKTSVYSITGMRNYAPNYKALPMVLGRVRYAPPYGALPYTINKGNDQYLYVDVVWGHGPLQIEDLKLGETSLSAYSEVTVASKQGYPTDAELKLLPNDVYPDQFGAEIVYGTPVIRTTQLNTEQSIIELVFAEGLFGINDKTGDRQATTVTLEVRTSPTGAGTWTLIDTKTITDKAAYPKRVSITVNHFSAGQYDIRVDRTTPETGDKVYDKLTFSELKSVKFVDPVNFPIPVAETQLSIKGTDQLNGVIDNLNGWVTTICMDYEHTTGEWVKRPTNNNASLFRYVLEHTVTARPVVLSKIDLDALEEWHDFCRINGFAYNRIHDTSEPVPQIIRKICTAGRAMLVQPDGNWSVIIDRARTLGPVQMFTPANSKKLSSKKTFAEELHGYRIAFNDETADNRESEVIVYTQGYDESNAYILEALQFPGVTTAAEVIAHAKYHLAVRRYRSELFTWEADWEHLSCSRGDLVSIAHDCILVSQATGRIKYHDVLNKSITLDQAITVQAQTAYNLVIRTTPNGNEYANVFAKAVTAQFPDWTTDTLTYTGELPHTTRRGDVYSFGEAGKETILAIITSKKPKKDMSATLTALQYSWPEIESYMAGNFPALNSEITTPVFTSNLTPPPPTISYVATGLSSSFTNPDGTTENRITLVLTIPSGWAVSVDSVQVDIRTSEGWQRSPHTDPNEPIVFYNVAPGEHQVRARTVSADGRVSAWVYKTITQVDGTPKPQSLLSLTVEGNLFQNDVSWVLPVDFRDSYRIAIYCSPGLNDQSNVGPPVAILSGGTKWSHTGLIPEVQYYYWGRIHSAGVGSRETTLDTSLGWEDEEGSWQDDTGQWDGIDSYADPKFSDWYPLNRFGGVKASPITDNKRILDMLTESIGRGQLVTEINEVIDGAVEGINYQQQFLENAWTVKIQEIGGRPYMVGIGLVLYPDWKEGEEYVVDQYVWKDEEDNVYKCKADHTSSLENQPPIQTYWELIPYGKKSGVAIVADQFSVTTADGTGEVTPFVISGSIVGIDGTLIVNGTVRANALSATDIYVVNLQSANYVAGVSGYRINSVTGATEFNNITFQFNSTHVDQITTVINGTTISGTQISTPSISAISANLGNITAGQINFGSFIGYAWPGGTGGGAHLSAAGLLMGNPSTGQYVQLTAAGQLFLPSLTSSGGSTTFAGVLSGPIVKALNIEANILTVREIYGLARINGNRINAFSNGVAVVPGNSSVEVYHNLGRYVVVSLANRFAVLSGGAGNTINKFTIINTDSQTITVSYVYM